MYTILKGVETMVEECKDCQINYKMPFVFCCLYECGEHEFCRNCKKDTVKLAVCSIQVKGEITNGKK